METQPETKFSFTDRLFGWLILCGDMCNAMALLAAVVVISVLTWSWPDSTH